MNNFCNYDWKSILINSSKIPPSTRAMLSFSAVGPTNKRPLTHSEEQHCPVLIVSTSRSITGTNSRSLIFAIVFTPTSLITRIHIVHSHTLSRLRPCIKYHKSMPTRGIRTHTSGARGKTWRAFNHRATEAASDSPLIQY